MNPLTGCEPGKTPGRRPGGEAAGGRLVTAEAKPCSWSRVCAVFVWASVCSSCRREVAERTSGGTAQELWETTCYNDWELNTKKQRPVARARWSHPAPSRTWQ